MKQYIDLKDIFSEDEYNYIVYCIDKQMVRQDNDDIDILFAEGIIEKLFLLQSLIQEEEA